MRYSEELRARAEQILLDERELLVLRLEHTWQGYGILRLMALRRAVWRRGGEWRTVWAH